MISLKKILTKKEISDIINTFYTYEQESFFIEDIENNILFGKETRSESTSYPICINKEIIGYIKGTEKCSQIAQMISYIAKIENDKKEVIKDALEKYKQLTLLYDFSSIEDIIS